MAIFLPLHTERILHSLKTAFACILGLLITQLLRLPIDQWLVVTIIVVMCAQINVGSMLQKSYMRFLGTLTGSLLGAFTLLLFGNHKIAVACSIGISALLFSYLATSNKPYAESGTLGAVTTTIILIGQNPTFITAGMRFLEISVGILLAALVSQFVLPIHAFTHLRRTQALTLKQLADYYRIALMQETLADDNVSKEDLEEDIITLMTKQRKLAKEAKGELFNKKFRMIFFRKSLHCEKQILRCIVFMEQSKKSPQDYEILQMLNNKVPTVLTIIATQIAQKKPAAALIELPEIKPEKDTVFAFCAEILLEQLKTLHSLIKETL